MFLYYKCYLSIKLKFLEEFILIRQANQKSAILVTIGIFLDKNFKFQLDIYNRCHDLLMMSMESDIAILNIKDLDYRCIVSGINKSEPINLIKNIDLTEKSGTLYIT